MTEAQIQWDLTEGPHTWSGLQQQQRLPPVAEFYASEGPNRGRQVAREATTQEETEIREIQQEEEETYRRIEGYIDELVHENLEGFNFENDPDSEDKRRWLHEGWAEPNDDRDLLPDEVDSDFWESHSARST